VSHTAFSHVIDYVFGGHDSQSYHEEVKEEYMAASDLPGILARFGYEWHDFLDESLYPLLERPAPALCADRLDYFLRDSQDLGLATPADIGRVLGHLAVWNDRIVVADLDTARWLARTYMAADEGSWANFREVGLYEVAAQAIKRGLEVGAISEADLWRTDEVAWARLHQSTDGPLAEMLSLVSAETAFVWDDEAPTFRISTKLRTIDPDVLLGDHCRPLSALDPVYARDRHAYLNSKQGKWPIRVVPAGLVRRPDLLPWSI
jgi:HD superfamily phosphohydrolase